MHLIMLNKMEWLWINYTLTEVLKANAKNLHPNISKFLAIQSCQVLAHSWQMGYWDDQFQ